MAHGKSDDEIVKGTHNTARFFVETRHISWVLLIATCLWGVYGYFSMPQRKDPEVPVRLAVALTPWPGASAENIENLVTKKLESKIAENATTSLNPIIEVKGAPPNITVNLYRGGLKVSGNVCDPHYRPKDGDAAFLDPGTAIYAVNGHPTSDLLAVHHGSHIVPYRAHPPPA